MTPPPAADLETLLTQVPTRRMRRRLVRCVPQLDFMTSGRPRFLYTSGRPNRCNPAGVESAWVKLRKIIDLDDARLLRILDLSVADFKSNWRRTRALTRLQTLGQAISRQSSIAALRYPSAAAIKLGRSGWNVAIFPSALTSPDQVEILGNSPDPLEVLP